jgi:hypothetical protein
MGGEDIETQKRLTRSINTQMTKQSWRRENIFAFFLKSTQNRRNRQKRNKKNVTTRTERENKKQSRGLD